MIDTPLAAIAERSLKLEEPRQFLLPVMAG